MSKITTLPLATAPTGAEALVLVQGGQTKQAPLEDLFDPAAARAEAAAAAAAAAGRYFPDQAAGEAGSTTGQLFCHPDGYSGLVYREKTAGGSIVIGVSLTKAYVDGRTREKLTGNRTFFVRLDGNDANNGLADTAGGAFLTPQRAVNAAYALDRNGYRVTIVLGPGTHTSGIRLWGPLLGEGDTDGQPLHIIGNEADNTAVSVIPTGTSALVPFPGANVLVAGITFGTIGSGYGWLGNPYSTIEHRNCRLVDVAQEMILTLHHATLRALGHLTVQGDAVSFCHATKRSIIDFDSQSIAFVDNPTFSTYLWGINDATINLAQCEITGAVTGAILVHKNGWLNTAGMIGSYLGGSAPVVQDGGRISTGSLGEAAQFYVRPGGSNNGDGLVNSDSRAFATLQGAVDALEKMPVDPMTVAAGGGRRACAINIAPGTFTGPVTLRDIPAFSEVNIVGDEATWDNVHINTAGPCFTADGIRTNYILRGMKLSADTSNCIVAQRGSIVSFRNIEFGAASIHRLAETGGQINAIGDYRIVGSALFHIVQRYGSIVDTPGVTVTLVGTPAFTVFHYSMGGMARWTGTTFVGNATGKRYEIHLNGGIDTNGAPPDFLRGDVDGELFTGGRIR